MLRSRRMLLIGAIVLGVVLLGTLVTLLLGAGRDPYKGTCDTFLKHVMNKDADKSYAMLSPSARSVDSQQSWSEKVVSLEYIYKGGKLTFDKKTDAAQTTEGAGEEGAEATTSAASRFQLNYTLVHPAATSQIECVVIGNDGKHVIDGFATAEKQQPEVE